MSRIGKQPIKLEKGVSANINGNVISLKGPKGELSHTLNPGISVKQEDDQLVVSRQSDDRFTRSYHGLDRALIANMVTGVNQGFSRVLEINGVGYKAEAKGDTLTLTVGFTNPYPYKLPKGVSASVEKNTRVTLSGMDKQKVGQAAAEIRALRPPEPYKGKGIKYADEQIKRKVGKTSA